MDFSAARDLSKLKVGDPVARMPGIRFGQVRYGKVVRKTAIFVYAEFPPIGLEATPLIAGYRRDTGVSLTGGKSYLVHPDYAKALTKVPA